MPNGVDPLQMRASRDEPPRAEPRVAAQASESQDRVGTVEVQSRADPGPYVTTTRDQLDQGVVVSPAPSSGFATVASASPRRERRVAGPLSGQPHRAERTVSMQYAYEATEGQPMVTWVERLTEFLDPLRRGRVVFREGF